MSKQATASVLAIIQRRYSALPELPRHRRLYELVRALVLEGELPAGAKLPSSRMLAVELGVSRHTVSTALDQLLGEGYLVGRQGSGTYVSRRFDGRGARRELRSATGPQPPRISQRGVAVAAATRSPFNWDSGPGSGPKAFRVGLPAVDVFPATRWGRVLGAAWRQPASARLGYQEPVGYLPLREAISAYLRASRGLVCKASQIIIVAGSQAALDLSLRVLIDPGEVVALEDPGYLGARGAVTAAGGRALPISVDAQGMVSADLIAADPAPRVAFVTPTHQFPVGATMSLDRRIALLDWARAADAWILEDDYDSEYRYGGRLFDPLAVLDHGQRVIYIGTFSKVMFPALRLGYLVVPESLTEAFEAAQLASNIHRPLLEQVALASFMEQGYFAQHLRLSREVHTERREALLASLETRLGEQLAVQPASAGLHLLGLLPDGSDDLAAFRRAAESGVEVWPLSIHGIDDDRRGLLLGFGSAPPAMIGPAVERLARALDEQ